MEKNIKLNQKERWVKKLQIKKHILKYVIICNLLLTLKTSTMKMEAEQSSEMSEKCLNLSDIIIPLPSPSSLQKLFFLPNLTLIAFCS
jgi:hypothetical protein